MDKLGILGGGFSGLSLARYYDGDSEIIEMNSIPGGHCRSHVKDGFRYDEGGHILFSRDQELLNKLLQILGNNIDRHYRVNKIWYKKRFVKYPFENGLGDLDKEDIFYCLYNYLKNDYPEPTNFQEWIFYTFGKGISDCYLIPYNQKIWRSDLSQLALDWAGARVPRPPLEDIVKSALGIPTEGYTHQLNFFYPLHGGIQALTDALVADIRSKCVVRANRTISSLRKVDDYWIIKDDKDENRYRKIVSSIPVDQLLRCLENVPDDVLAAANSLRHNSSIFVMLGLSDCLAKDITSVYFPDPTLPFHRVGFPHSYDPECTPPNKYIAVAEISCPGENGRWLWPDEKIVDEVVDSLVREGFISYSHVLVRDIARERYSYVVYDNHHASSIKLIRIYINSLGIELLGRFGEFEYWNLDQCLDSAMNLADRLSQKGHHGKNKG